MKKELIPALLVSLFIFCLVPASGQNMVNGFNATTVQYPGGSFTQDVTGVWKERNATSAWTFKLKKRDEWSVYLYDTSRKLSVQLDLFKKEIILDWDKPGRSKLYDVSKALNGAGGSTIGKDVINGYNTTFIGYDGGSFFKDASGAWKEGTVTNIWTFKETRRDEWSVYLFDESRQMSIQLDLYKKEIILNWERSDRRKLYDVTKALDGPVGFLKWGAENDVFNTNETIDVAYGANGKFVYKYGVTGQVKFNNATFGDPAPGVRKMGYFKRRN